MKKEPKDYQPRRCVYRDVGMRDVGLRLDGVLYATGALMAGLAV